MGNCGSFQISCDEVVNRVIGCLCRKGYIGNLKKNLRDLEREMEDLRASQNVLKNKVAREEAQQRQKLKTVQVWLTRVERIGTRVDDILKVKKLRSEDNFQEVTELTPTYVVVERPTQPTVGQEEMLEKAWNRLLEDGAGIMGLHGENISKLQEDIARKLHLCGEEWTNKNESDKAAEIHTVLKRQRFVLMLDDIWEKMDLEAIRVPEPTIENGCKVVFTTRSEDVCKRMGDHQPMQVKCLKEDQAWELFKLKIGYEKLRREPRIDGLTRKVAEKCHGLPLALSIIGETMASKTMVQEWEDAIDFVRWLYGLLPIWGKTKRILLFKQESDYTKYQKSKTGELSKCSELTTLLLQDNYYLKNLSGEVIQHMQKLVVLDLSSNLNISGLPDRISELNSLQYLDLSDTRVEQLPVGDVDLVKELQLLEHLQVLTIDVSSELGLKQILGDQRLVNCIYRLHIHDFQEKPFDLSLLVSMENLRELRVTTLNLHYAGLGFLTV
ncbi:BnaA09g13850D [Brassica napus]|uniref:BnaA09g13850D protein n=1 Tax=Brassica napus TaxID=3708 RepID=A0A078FIS3_BRANA|nr:BnaA09g13850D [Brassica napus]